MTCVNSMLRILRNLEISLLKWTGLHKPGMPALAGVNLPCDDRPKSAARSLDSILDSIFGSKLWAAVPKNRRSAERRMTRKMAKFHLNDAIPKKNIVACLECGHWHQSNTICGNCYSKVREETKEMRRSLGEDIRYSAPESEIVFLYDAHSPFELESLLKLDVVFYWEFEQKEGCLALENLCSKPPVLAYYNEMESLEIECAASENGMEAVLLREGNVIAYATVLQWENFSVKYRPGKEMKIPDALSRYSILH
ncbi:hypothetical protein ScPMuIL_012144 [Solemya velum]